MKHKLKELYSSFMKCEGLYKILAILTILLGIGIMVGIILGVQWLFWQLWMFVIPSVFTTAPEHIKHPDFWVFFGLVVLFSWIRTLIFRKTK